MTDIARERRLLAAQGLDIATRETWGATQDYRSARSVVEPAVGFVLHISVTIDHGDLTGLEHADMRTIERVGQQRFGIGFPYNAAVFDTGRLYEGQPLTRRGAHTVDDKKIGYPSMGTSRSMNYHWRAICLPQMVDDDVTDAQVDQCARWAAAQIRSGMARPDVVWIGHRDVAYKSCPGNTGYGRLGDIRRLTAYYVAKGLGPPVTPTVPEEDVMLVKCFEDGSSARPWLLSFGSVYVPLTKVPKGSVPVLELGAVDYDEYRRKADEDEDISRRIDMRLAALVEIEGREERAAQG